MELFAKFVDKECLPRLDLFSNAISTTNLHRRRRSFEKERREISNFNQYGLNLQSEHERWLTEKHFKCPVTVFNFHKEIKPFYMRLNERRENCDGDGPARFPGIGEIVAAASVKSDSMCWRRTCAGTK